MVNGLPAKKAFHHHRTKKKTKRTTGLIPKTKTNSIRLTQPQQLLVLQIGTGHALELRLANRFVVTLLPQERIPVFGTSRRTQTPVWLLKNTTGRAPQALSGLPVGDLAPAQSPTTVVAVVSMAGMHHQAMLVTALRTHMVASSQWCHTQTNTTLSRRRKTLALAEVILAMIIGVTGVVVK